ncbi:class I SAM-dependent RNA methyltransferase [Bombella sp. TMW 2.2559]|uniref:Class I SAM-dependent RNA methyltransferase n=1 Tax=Bombella dulcis TaxID=2967339 RepID=A0ABT3WG97_9PROT|nr:class I SAM-dependent RNA methyltransferase [Bombella dulcis]MCX5615911.1 class I SAM-dependent RNA methyltransferase [Bombella dulcis]
MMETSTQSRATVEQLGRSGDGMVRHDGQTWYIPGTLPGEQLHLHFHDGQVELLDRESSASERVTPPCSLAEHCGGCALQHMDQAALLDWKKDQVQRVLNRSGFTDLPEPALYQTPPHSRQRLDVALQRVPGGMVLGLHQRGGDPVDMTECPLIRPELLALLPALRQCLSSLGALTSRANLAINLLESGPDLMLETPAPLSGSDREKLAAFARAHRIPRITWRSAPGRVMETAAQTGPVFHHFGGVKVSPPPASFLQASQEGEQAIRDAVLAGLPPLNRKDRIIELYAGCGTLTFPLAQHGFVQAYEGDRAAITALRAATHGSRAEGVERDLNRQPLLPPELNQARVVVLDPPYAGTGKQLASLLRSKVQDMVYVSCNPAALEKELPAMKQAGFAILSWTVIDQFLWSTDVETVLVLSRDPKRIRKAEKKRKG